MACWGRAHLDEVGHLELQAVELAQRVEQALLAAPRIDQPVSQARDVLVREADRGRVEPNDLGQREERPLLPISHGAAHRKCKLGTAAALRNTQLA
jgi:hypothetical protein